MKIMAHLMELKLLKKKNNLCAGASALHKVLVSFMDDLIQSPAPQIVC